MPTYCVSDAIAVEFSFRYGRDIARFFKQREKPSFVTAKFVHEDKEKRQEEYSDFFASAAKKRAYEDLANLEINLKGSLSGHDYDEQNPSIVKLEGKVPSGAQPGLYRCDTVKVEFSGEEEAPNNFEAVNECAFEESPNDFKEVPNLRLRIANPYELRFEGWKWGNRSR